MVVVVSSYLVHVLRNLSKNSCHVLIPARGMINHRRPISSGIEGDLVASKEMHLSFCHSAIPLIEDPPKLDCSKSCVCNVI